MAARLSAAEREEIGLGRAAGESLRSIGRRLGRAASTVGREVARYERYGQAYRPRAADWAAWLRHRRPRRPAKLVVNLELRRVALDGLRRRRSPQQLAARLMWVSHETIYQAIYLQARGNLRAELTRQVAVRSGRARRRPRAGEDDGRSG